MSRSLSMFPGGIKPAPNKAQSSASPIRAAGIPAELIFPLLQRQADAIPLVTVGQAVKKGELIARAADAHGAPIHASTSGQVIAIEARPIAHSEQQQSMCIVLRSDGEDRWHTQPTAPDPHSLSVAELVQRIRAAGIIGAGGAGFPAAAKLCDEHGSVRNIHTLIINGVECEPYITADDRLMRERADAIVQGIQLLQKILQPQATSIAIEDEQRASLDAMRDACVATNIDVVAVPTIYPMGSEAQLIQVLTGSEIPSAGKPVDTGILCFNIGTVYAIYRALCLGEVMLSRIVTITGKACAYNGNFDVLVGTPLRHVLEIANFDAGKCSRVIAGGSLMGFPVASLDAPTGKTSHCFIAATADEFPVRSSAQPCIRCGFCAEACPVQLLPQQLFTQSQQNNHARLADLHLFDCIECGACDYVCPSQIALVDAFRQAKRSIQVEAFEQQQALQARLRFEAHQTRILRGKHERDKQREQRLHAAATVKEHVSSATAALEPDKKAAIQAAIARAKAKKSGAAQRPAVAAALTQTEPTGQRLRQRIAELERLLQEADASRRARLQRSIDDLKKHLDEAESQPDAESVRAQIENALLQARKNSGDEPT